MFDIGLPELIIILVILLLLFGSKQLPKLSRSIGESARELRDGLTGEKKQTKTKPKPKTRGTGEGPTAA